MTRILLVDDRFEARDALARRLRRRGFEVVTAGDGAEALRTVRGERVDLVVMDLDMPVLDGWEATRRIKEDPATRAIPVLVLTAHFLDHQRKLAEDAGCDDFVTRPAAFSHLLGRIERLLPPAGATP